MVDVTGVEPVRYDEVRGLLKLQSADPVDTAKTQAAELGLKTDLPRHGYVFSNVGASEIEVDFESETGSYSIPVETGPLARMDAIHVSGDRIFGPKHIGRWEERRGGQEGGSTCRLRGSPYHQKKKFTVHA